MVAWLMIARSARIDRGRPPNYCLPTPSKGKSHAAAAVASARNSGFAGPADADGGADARLRHCHRRGSANRTDDLTIEDAALYQALHRLDRQGLVEAEWRPSENNRRARYYRLTPPGRKRLREETANWRRYSRAVEAVLKA